MSNMDRALPPRPRLGLIAGVAAGVALLIAGSVNAVLGQINSVTIESAELRLARTHFGRLDATIPARAEVVPQHTTLLEAVEGGRVEEVFAQSGDIVRRGELILRLSNAELRLQTIARETDIAQQINDSKTLELDLQRSKLALERDIIEADHEITALEKRIDRRRGLVEDGAESEEVFDELVGDLRHWRRLRENLVQSLEVETRHLDSQAEKAKSISDKLSLNLEIAKRSLDALDVKAPIDGRLTAFAPKVGETLQQGEQFGRIDSLDGIKLEAKLDQRHAPSLAPGMSATATLNGATEPFQIIRVLPEIINGQFSIELEPEGVISPSLRRGQNVALQINLNAARTDALVAPAGPWLEDTGGNWAFVISNDGKTAERRLLTSGRRTSTGIEVFNGLEAGETIIISSYSAFLQADRIRIQPSLQRSITDAGGRYDAVAYSLQDESRRLKGD